MTEDRPPELKVEKKSRTAVFERPGSARAVASASWTILMAIAGSLLLFFYQIRAGNVYVAGELSYFSSTGAIFALATAISVGSGAAFLRFAKEGYTIDEEKGKHRAVQMAKINLTIGLFSNIAIFVLAFISINDSFLFLILFGAATAILVSFVRDILTNMLSVFNRFDMTSVIGIVYGVTVFLFGFSLIIFNLPAELLIYTILIMMCVMVILSAIFYQRIKKKTELGFKDLLLPSKQYPIQKEFAKKYLKYGITTTISNLVVFGIFSHIVVLMITICYNSWGGFLGLAGAIDAKKMIQLLTIIDVFVFIEVAIILFSGPLTVEIAEACAKNDQECIENSVNHVGKVGIILSIPISLVMVILARSLLLVLVPGTVAVGSPAVVTEDLLFQGWVTMAITAFGQAFYGLACIFGSALIGSGHAKRAAIGIGISGLLLFITTPLFLFLFGYIDGIFPIFGTSTYSLIGAGVAFLISGIFVLPYLARETKRLLKIEYDLRIKKLIICMVVLAAFFLLAPIQPDVVSLTAFILLGSLLCIFCYCFFGVIGKGDGKLVQDTFDSFNLGGVGRLLRKIGRFFYNLNPFNEK